jgi:hypothetical protein
MCKNEIQFLYNEYLLEIMKIDPDDMTDVYVLSLEEFAKKYEMHEI